MRYRLFIFDFDGTLADSAPWMGVALHRAAAKLGFRQLSAEEMEALRGRDSRAVFQSLCVPPERLPELVTIIRELARDELNAPLFPGIADMLRSLHAASARIAVVTSNSEPPVRRALGPELEALISDFNCDAPMFGKAAKFAETMARVGVGAAETLSVGDETRDIDAARELGVATCAVPWGYATLDVLQALKPDHVIASAAEIAALV